jgi:hypothetical protein
MCFEALRIEFIRPLIALPQFELTTGDLSLRNLLVAYMHATWTWPRQGMIAEHTRHNPLTLLFYTGRHLPHQQAKDTAERFQQDVLLARVSSQNFEDLFRE